MKLVDPKTIIVGGNLYTDMLVDKRLLSENPSDITIHVKKDVFFGIFEKPKRIKSEDWYFKYEDFINTYGSIYDIIAYSDILK